METLKIENTIPTMSGGMDFAAISALVNQNKGMSPEALVAMCQNKGFGGGDGAGLLLFILLILGLGGNGFGGLGGNNNVQAQNNFDTSTILRAIDGNTADIRALSGALNVGFDRTNDAICHLAKSVESVAAMVGSTSKDVINSIQAGNCQLSRQLSDCCCTIQKDLAALNTNLVNGFSQVGFETSKQTCEIVEAVRSEGQATRALIEANDKERLREENNALKLQVSQAAQTAAIEDAIAAAVKRATK